MYLCICLKGRISHPDIGDKQLPHKQIYNQCNITYTDNQMTDYKALFYQFNSMRAYGTLGLQGKYSKYSQLLTTTAPMSTYMELTDLFAPDAMMTH